MQAGGCSHVSLHFHFDITSRCCMSVALSAFVRMRLLSGAILSSVTCVSMVGRRQLSEKGSQLRICTCIFQMNLCWDFMCCVFPGNATDACYLLYSSDDYAIRCLWFSAYSGLPIVAGPELVHYVWELHCDTLFAINAITSAGAASGRIMLVRSQPVSPYRLAS